MGNIGIRTSLVVASLTILTSPGCTDPAEKFPAKTESTPAQCQDKKDNDGDGFIDCQDQDCKGLEVCKKKLDGGGPDGKVMLDRGARDGPGKDQPSPLDGPGKDQPSPLDGPGKDQPSPPDGPGKDQPSPPDGPGKDQPAPPDGPVVDQSIPLDAPWPDLLPTPDFNVCPPATACTTYIHSDTGTCIPQGVKKGTICDDNKAFTKADQCDGMGTCAGTAYSCADTFACTTDTCDGKGGCQNTLTAGYCLINNACYKEGAADSQNKCNRCVSTTSTKAWTLDPACKTLTFGLVAYYPFTGDTNDESGNANHGNSVNATLVADRHNNPKSAVHFNGTNAYVQVPHSAKINFSHIQDFSISLWVKITKAQAALGHPHEIMSKWNSYNAYPYMIRTYDSKSTGNGRISYGRWDVAHFPYADSKAAINDDKWHHLVFMKKASTLSLHVDGKLDSSTTDTTTSSTANTDNLYIGCRGLPPNQWRFYTGGVDDLRIYNRALSAAEIATLFGI